MNRRILKLMGAWPKENQDENNLMSFTNLRSPLIILWILVGLFLPQLYALIQVYPNLRLVVDNLITTCAVFTSVLKFFFLWNNRQVLQPVIESIKKDWAQSTSDWEHSIMVKQAKRGRLFTISGQAIMFICFIGFTVSPFFNLSVRIINNVTDPIDGRYFPLQTYYPYDCTLSPNFEITYVIQCIAGCLAGVSLSAPDNFFGALVFHACAQCEILSAKFAEILPQKFEKNEWTGDEVIFFRTWLKYVVDEHIGLIRFVDAIEISFNLLILAQVSCLSIIMICLGFNVIQSMNIENESLPLVQVMTLAGTILSLMIHILVYCIASEILAEHSLGFFHSVYASHWYTLPQNCSRDIIPIMVRSKEPLRLSAGKFFYLSLNIYLSIMKSAAGYISVLLTVSS